MKSIHDVNLRSIDLNLLAVFDAIYTAGNLTRAAKTLGLSQPAMSNALARLRLALDDPLFARTTKGMRPTWRARILAPPIRQALQLIQSGLREGTNFDYRSSTRTFVIAVEDYGEVVIIPRFMDWLSRVAPGIQIRIRAEPGRALSSELKDGQVDLAMEYFFTHDSALEVQHLLDETFVPIVRTNHPTVRNALTVKQYVGLPHVIFGRKATTWTIIDRELAKLRLTRKVALQVPHFLSMPLIVENTNFVSTIPNRMAAVYTRHFAVKALKMPLKFPPLSLYLMWSKSMNNDPGHRWLRESFREIVSTLTMEV